MMFEYRCSLCFRGMRGKDGFDAHTLQERKSLIIRAGMFQLIQTLGQKSGRLFAPVSPQKSPLFGDIHQVKGKRAGLKKGKRNRQRSGGMYGGVCCRRQEKGRHAVGELGLAILAENLLKSPPEVEKLCRDTFHRLYLPETVFRYGPLFLLHRRKQRLSRLGLFIRFFAAQFYVFFQLCHGLCPFPFACIEQSEAIAYRRVGWSAQFRYVRSQDTES